jgi:phosphatidylethanolamine/phosphatidyl-N-methylethanolamine N-methyltransferase
MKNVYETIMFASNDIRNPLQNASLIPSSKAASVAMVQSLDFSRIDTIVELGPGTGVFTQEVLKRCKPDAKIILIEIERSYVGLLKWKFGDRVIVENASAHHLDELLAKHGMVRPDLVLSGLPFLKKETRKLLFGSIKRYTDKGTIFRFFTYMPPVMKHVYRELPVRRLSFILGNFPPFWVYGIN